MNLTFRSGGRGETAARFPETSWPAPLTKTLGVLKMKDTEPEIQQLSHFLVEFNKESDRGAALVAASMLDERLQEILSNFLVESPTQRNY